MTYTKAELEAVRTTIYSMLTVHEVFDFIKDDVLALKLLNRCMQAGIHPLTVIETLKFLRQFPLDILNRLK